MNVIAGASLSLSLVEHSVFKKFVNLADLCYELKGRKWFTNTQFTDSIEAVKKLIKKEFNNVSFFSLALMNGQTRHKSIL